MASKKKTRKPLEKDWIDISVPLKDAMVHWPDDPSVKIKQIQNMDKGDDCNLTHISMCAHAGTHMDSPHHFRKSGKSIDKLPLSATIGVARVIEINDSEFITLEELRPHKIRSSERILFKTKNSSSRWENKPFKKKFVHLSTEAANYLAKRSVQTIGIDYLSIGGYGGHVVDVQNIILKAGIWVVEGLNLRNIQPGTYELICLPIKIHGSDGSPARAIIRQI